MSAGIPKLRRGGRQSARPRTHDPVLRRRWREQSPNRGNQSVENSCRPVQPESLRGKPGEGRATSSSARRAAASRARVRGEERRERHPGPSRAAPRAPPRSQSRRRSLPRAQVLRGSQAREPRAATPSRQPGWTRRAGLRAPRACLLPGGRSGGFQAGSRARLRARSTCCCHRRRRLCLGPGLPLLRAPLPAPRASTAGASALCASASPRTPAAGGAGGDSEHVRLRRWELREGTVRTRAPPRPPPPVLASSPEWAGPVWLGTRDELLGPNTAPVVPFTWGRVGRAAPAPAKSPRGGFPSKRPLTPLSDLGLADPDPVWAERQPR